MRSVNVVIDIAVAGTTTKKQMLKPKLVVEMKKQFLRGSRARGGVQLFGEWKHAAPQ